MITDVDIYRSAQEMIRQHGDKVPREAVAKAERFMRADDGTGAAIWLRVVEAIRVLQGREVPRGAKKH